MNLTFLSLEIDPRFDAVGDIRLATGVFGDIVDEIDDEVFDEADADDDVDADAAPGAALG